MIADGRETKGMDRIMNRTDKPDIKQMILYEDRDILVCHKAAGLPVQSAGVGTKDMESILKNYLKERQQAEPEKKTGRDSVGAGSREVPYLGIIHRLDQPVEGILVFAKNKKAAAGLSRQISRGMLKKVYLAVCCVDNVPESGDKIRNLSGDLEEERGSASADISESGLEKKLEKGTAKKGGDEGSSSGSGKRSEKETGKMSGNEGSGSPGSRKGSEKETWENPEIHLTDWIRKEASINTSVIVSPDMAGAKKAELKYCILQRRTIQGKEYALVRISLLTGRHHQIRVQMANAGLPLYGDRKYNARQQEYHIWEYDAELGARLMLCASELTFRHPETGKEMRFAVKPLFVEKFLKLCIDQARIEC